MHCSNGYLKQGGFPQLLSQFFPTSCYFKNFNKGRGNLHRTADPPNFIRTEPSLQYSEGLRTDLETNYLLPCDRVITCARVIMISDQSVLSKRGGAC